MQPLRADDFPAIHAAFLEAFSDYAVSFQISADDLREMLTRRGWVPQASVAEFEGDRIVAFTLNGLGTWNGHPAGYDSGTGVVPSHRSRGLSGEMLTASVDLLRTHGAKQYVLEVLQSNERAFGIYKNSGFEVTRELQCWSFETNETPPGAVREVPEIDWDTFRSWFDVEPSWQNSIDAVLRARSPRRYLTVDGAGFAVVFPNGDLPLLAVSPAARRQGIGRSLLHACATRPLRILNIPLGYGDAFLNACGAEQTVRQYEMVRPF